MDGRGFLFIFCSHFGFLLLLFGLLCWSNGLAIKATRLPFLVGIWIHQKSHRTIFTIVFRPRFRIAAISSSSRKQQGQRQTNPNIAMKLNLHSRIKLKNADIHHQKAICFVVSISIKMRLALDFLEMSQLYDLQYKIFSVISD